MPALRDGYVQNRVALLVRTRYVGVVFQEQFNECPVTLRHREMQRCLAPVVTEINSGTSTGFRQQQGSHLAVPVQRCEMQSREPVFLLNVDQLPTSGHETFRSTEKITLINSKVFSIF